jgi:hypothetical protein
MTGLTTKWLPENTIEKRYVVLSNLNQKSLGD